MKYSFVDGSTPPQELGLPLGGNFVGRQIGDQWVAISVGPTGFSRCDVGIACFTIYFTQPDCVGTPYLSTNTDDFGFFAWTYPMVGTALTYPKIGTTAVRDSYSTLSVGNGIASQCESSLTPSMPLWPNLMLAEARTVDTAKWGLTMPFKMIVQP